MNVLVPILADFGDVITLVVFVVILLLGVAGRLMNKVREAQQKGAEPRQVGPGQPRRPPQRGPLANEIEDFVRKAAQRRAGGGVQPGQQPQAGRQPQAGQHPQAGQQPQAGQPPQMAPRRPIPPPMVARLEPEVPVEVELLEPVVEAESVAEHVRGHVGRHTGDETLGKVASRHISSPVELADDKLEARVRDVFDHKLGRLEGTLGESASGAEALDAETPEDRVGSLPSTAAAGLVAMFANPGNIRQAILISEILQRPEHRWS